MSTTPIATPAAAHFAAAASASWTPRPLLTITAASLGRFAQDVALAELEHVVGAVEHGRGRAHDADVDQAAIAFHDPVA